MAKTRPAPKTKRPTKKEQQKERELQRHLKATDTTPPEPVDRPVIRKIICRTERQKEYLQFLNEKRLTISTGPAGVGKTFICTVWACEQLDSSRISRIIFTRPAVEAAEENLGFLPGELEEKFAPWFEPFRRILVERYGESKLENMMKRGKIEVSPLAYMRGLTFDNAAVLLDEAQNSTPKQMKLLLTRLGESSICVVNGDLDQKDIEGVSGLEDIVHRFDDMPEVGVVEFDEEDIVRSGLVRELLRRYRVGAR